MSEVKRYTIRTIEDFFAVPQEKLVECLHDFALFLHLKAVAEAAAPGQVRWMSERGFEWIDDGKHDANVSIQNPDGEMAMRETIPFDGPALHREDR